MFSPNLLFFLVAAVHFAYAAQSISVPQSKNCVFPIGSRRDYTAQWPLVFKSNGELYPIEVDSETKELQVLVKGGDEVLLSCGPNYLKQYFREEMLSATCCGATGDFIVKDVEKAARKLTCDLRVIEEVVDTVDGCVENGNTARFGYVDPNEKQTYLLGEACYDTNAGATKFVHFKLGDKSFSHLEKKPKNYLTTRGHPDGRYKIELFHGLAFDDIYETIRNGLKIKIAPQLKIANYVDDVLLSNAQFQAIKKLSWNYYVGFDENEILETLKSDIKHLSEGVNLEMYVGGHGVKTLHGPSGATMDVYLQRTPNRFPMPALLWFVVKHDDKATAFAVVNNHGNSLSEDLHGNGMDTSNLCKHNSCNEITWLSPMLQQNEKLICCDVNDFRQTVQEVPVISGIKGMLK